MCIRKMMPDGVCKYGGRGAVLQKHADCSFDGNSQKPKETGNKERGSEKADKESLGEQSWNWWQLCCSAGGSPTVVIFVVAGDWTAQSCKFKWIKNWNKFLKINIDIILWN